MPQKNRIIIVCSVLSLCFLGVIMVYSSSSVWANYKYNNSYKYFLNQSMFLILGIILMQIFSKINYKIYYKYSKVIILIIIALLIMVLIPGIGIVRNGSRSWFGIGSFSIQPSEFAKLGIIIYISRFLSRVNNNLNNQKIFIPCIIMLLIVFFLVMLQPDFGTGIIILMSGFGIMFIAGLNIKIFFKLGIAGIIGIVILVIIAPYRLERIVAFLNPWNDPLGSGFQIIQSLYSISPGGLFGLGIGNSIQKHFYLPEPQTDFIFSIISEELGFLGVIIISLLFILIFVNSMKISLNSKDLFGKYLSFGITFSLMFQTILNLCVVVGLVPVTGVTLPFLSYGGSSLLITFCSMGIILNISRYQR